MKIFIGLTEVSGYFGRLEQGFKELGLDTCFVALQDHRFNYFNNSTRSIFIRFASYCVKKRIKYKNGNIFQRFFCLNLTFISRIFLFIWALGNYDVFIMGAGSSFFNFHDLAILRLFNKKVIYTLHGTDSRPPYLDGAFLPSDYGLIAPVIGNSGASEDVNNISFAHVKIAAARKAQVKKIENYANYVICGLGWGQFFAKPFVNFASMGIAMPDDIQLSVHSDKLREKEADNCAIIHAPTNAHFKGTEVIRKIMNELKAEGLKFTYIEVSGVKNSEMLRLLAQSDLLVDQIYSDTLMAGLAAEAAFLGVPTVLSGYCENVHFGNLEQAGGPPIIYCHPDTLKSRIRELINDPVQRARLGEKARSFVERNWTAKSVAERFLALIHGRVNPDWIVDPLKSPYMYGAGLSEGQIKTNVSNLVKSHGIHALQLSHNEKLLNMFLGIIS